MINGGSAYSLSLTAFHGSEPLEQGNALPDFFPEGGQCVLGVANGLDARARVLAVGSHQKDFCAQALVEDRRQITDLIDKGAVAARSHDHDGAARPLFFFELFDASLCVPRAPGEK